MRIIRTDRCKSTTEEVEWPWQRWCRLCAKDDPLHNVNVFCKIEENIVDTALATAIGKYFWVNIKQNEGISEFLCIECHKLVMLLLSFTERVNKVQAMFCLLKNSSHSDVMDPNEVRIQYGLLDEDREHIIKSDSEENIELQQSESESRAARYKDDQEVELNEGDDDVDDDDDYEDEEEEEEVGEIDGENTEEDAEEEEETLEDEEEEGVEYEERQEPESELGNDEMIKTENHEIHFEILDEEYEDVRKDENSEGINERNSEGVDADADGEVNAKSIDAVQDSDLFKELKYNADDDNDGADKDEQRKNLVQSQSGNNNALEESPSKKAEKDTQICDGGSQENHVDWSSCLAKRKRGRPPKNAPNRVFGHTTDADATTKRMRIDSDNDVSQTEYKYVCKVCLRKYKNLTPYRKHMIDMHKVEPDVSEFACNQCDKVFPSEKQLVTHSRRHMSLEEKLDVPCPYCDRKFSYATVMKQHISGVHYNQKPYICDECGRALKTLAALNEHKLVHSSDCPYGCTICEKRFKTKARLKIHADTHTETTYVCTVCGMQLNTRRTLKMHMLVHSDNKNYKCNFCGAGFKRSKALKNHLILHTGLRPYKCNFCSKTFSNGSNCRSHKKKVHPIELAAEEALGKKKETTHVPKLEELRSSTNVIENPRKVQRHSGGLPAHMRALLIAAEERAKRDEAKSENNVLNDGNTIVAVVDDGRLERNDEDTDFIEIDNYNVKIDRDADDSNAVHINANFGDNDDEEETVIYEIIDEI